MPFSTLQDLITAVENLQSADAALKVNGTNSMLANLNFGGFKPINVTSGTAALPAFCVGNDDNTGIFGPAADTWAIATNGTERLRINSTGFCSINDTSDTTFRLRLGGRLRIGSSNSGEAEIAWGGVSNTANVAWGCSTRGDVGGNNDDLKFYRVNPATGAFVGIAMQLQNSTGNIGIGTASPDAPLDIETTLGSYSPTVNDSIRITNSSGTGQAILQAQINGTLRGRWRVDYLGNVVYVANGGDHIFYAGGDAGVGAEQVRINGYGLGIGVTPFPNNLSKALDFEDHGGMFGHNVSLYISANTYHNGGWLRKTTGYGSLYVVDAAAGQHLWYVSGFGGTNTGISWSQVMQLDNAGRLGIGTSPNASYRLTVADNAIIGGAGVSYPGTASYIGGSGNLIGFAWASPHIYGAVDNVVNAIVGTVSDYRLKENFAPFNTALERVLQLEVGTYNPKDFSGEVSEKVYCGVLAHVAGEIFPDLMTGEKDGLSGNGSPLYQSFNYSGLVPYMVVAIKELHKEILQLKRLIKP
jgi:hypothetical protein